MRSSNLRMFVVGGLLVAVGLAMLVSGFASSSPDGLDKVAAYRRTLADRASVRAAVAGDYRERLLAFLARRPSALASRAQALAAMASAA